MTVSPSGLSTQNCRGAGTRWIAEWQQITFGTGRHSLSSADWAEILLPRSFKNQNWQAVSLSGPSDSTAIGWENHLSSRPEYLVILGSAARSAAAPASFAVAATYESATVHTAVTSQTRGLPPFQGTSVRPSGRLPSDRTKPCGFLKLGIPGEVKARATIQWVVPCIFPGSLLFLFYYDVV